MYQVFIISDLHLGGIYPVPRDSGKRGFRLCTHTAAIARFVDALTKGIPERGRCELVVNGDIVDFLAERDGNSDAWSAFTSGPQQAVSKFDAIVERDRDVFQSFGRFLDAKSRLTILLGNHDVELSLPPVRAALRKAIGVKPGHDFEFIGDGEAYIVGDALIEHGNRYDAWNQIDYDALRRVRSLMSRHQAVPEQYRFFPPAGSEMVATVMNRIKEKYSFVDLLKPEDSAVVPILLALEPSYRQRFGAIARLWYSTRSHGLEGPVMPRIGGEINAAGPTTDMELGHDIAATEVGPVDADAALRQVLKSALGDEKRFMKLTGLEVPEESSLVGRNISALDTFATAKGIFDLVFGSREFEDRMSALLVAMRGLQKPDSFDRSKEMAKEYLDAARGLAKGDIRYVVFGHTHQAKQVDLGDGRWYFNSGTWADVLRFPIEILSLPDAEALEHLQNFVTQMKAGEFSGWTSFQPTYIRLDIGGDGKVLKAELCDSTER